MRIGDYWVVTAATSSCTFLMQLVLRGVPVCWRFSCAVTWSPWRSCRALRWTCNQQVSGSTAVRRAFGCSLGQAVHTIHTHTHTHVLLSPISINLVSASAGLVTLSHWSCVSQTVSGISAYGLTALVRERTTPRLRFNRSRATLPKSLHASVDRIWSCA